MSKNKQKRVSVRDAVNAVYRPNPTKIPGEEFDRNFMAPVDRTVYVYTIKGYHDYLDREGNPLLHNIEEANDAEYRSEGFAKEVIVDGNPSYYVKAGSSGRFYNPFGILDEGRHNKFQRSAGRYEFEYREVNLAAFQSYLNFLKTKNKAYLTKAEQEAF